MAKENVQAYLSQPGVQALRSRMGTSPKNIMVPQTCLEGMGRIALVDQNSVTWAIGDAFVIPERDVLEAALFGQDVNGRKAFGFTVQLKDGSAKNCFFSSFTKTAVPYKAVGTEFVRDEATEILQSNTPFANHVRGLGTQLDIFNYLADNAGKTIKVTDVKSVDIARRDWSKENTPIVGLQKTKVAFFNLEG